jgi:hypothetical protein
MAALRAILKALRRAVVRDLGTLASIKVNNLFLFVALLAYGALNSGQPPKSAEPFFVLLGFLLLFRYRPIRWARFRRRGWRYGR